MNPLTVVLNAAFIVTVVIVIVLIERHMPDSWSRRLDRARDNTFKLIVLIIPFIVLGEVIYQPIKLCVLPIFFFGGYYIWYDAFLKKHAP